MTREEQALYRRDALAELTNVIEDIFYTASLFRSAGDVEAAQKLGDLGDKFHDEYLRLRKGNHGN
jgi:hypothetical protein